VRPVELPPFHRCCFAIAIIAQQEAQMMKLPERNYYSFDELVNEKWKYFWPDITIGFIEDLIDSEKIHPSWYILEDFPDNSEDPNLEDVELEMRRKFKYYQSVDSYEREYKYYDECPRHDPHAKPNCIRHNVRQ
jgi:hypothetical protein